MTSTSDSVRERAGAAANEGRHVGEVTTGEVKNVAGEAAEQARQLAGELSSQVEEQARAQRDRVTTMLDSFSRDLDQMAEGSPSGLAKQAAYVTADRARRLGAQLDGREPKELLDDARAFARRRPGIFLLGALTAGVLVGRLVRGARDSGEVAGGSGGTSGGAAPTTATTAAVTPATESAGTAEGQPLSGATLPGPAPVVEEPAPVPPATVGEETR